MLQIQLSSTGQISMFPFAASYLNQPEEREKPALICGTCDLRLSYIDLVNISNGEHIDYPDNVVEAAKKGKTVKADG